MLKKFWNDPVWSTVIASLIAAGLLGLATYIFDLWSPIWAFLTKIFNFILSSTDVPNWVLGFLGVLSLPVVLLVLVFLREKFFPTRSQGIDWLSYTTDHFFGLRWRWHFLDGGLIHDLFSFCPACDFQVYAKDASGYLAVDHIAYECEHCGRPLADFKECPEALENRVKRSIQHKIRNGTWVANKNS